MKKTTQKKYLQKLPKRLLKYSALSAAMAGVADASGQIIYTDVNPDITEGNAASATFIDLNNDGTDDFAIGTINAPAVGFNGISPTDSWVGSQISYLYPFAFNNGEVISSGLSGWYGGSSNVGTLNYTSCYNGLGGSNWCGVTDKYLGLRFQISGNTHYGWARLDVSASGDSMTLKDFAYNSTPDAPIDAGQTSLSVDQFALNDVRVVALHQSIGLYNLPENTDYKVFDITGKTIIKGSISDNTYVIEANGSANGIYIVELLDTSTDKILRKKVVL